MLVRGSHPVVRPSGWVNETFAGELGSSWRGLSLPPGGLDRKGPSSVSDLLLLASVFGVTFAAELPDKSLFASLLLGTRYRPGHVWLGVAAAFALHVGLAVTVGGLLTLAPRFVIDGVSAALFLGGAAWMVWSGAHEEN